MKDLYKRPKIADTAADDQIRRSLGSADAELRGAAEMILLDPARRRVYDRNRQLLVAIGRLRFDLGLGYTRFWSRREFKDFWHAPAFAQAAPIPLATPKRRVDQVMIANAFHAARKVHHHGRHHVARWGWLWGVTGIAAVLTLIVFVVWHLSF